ncbi:MAG: hypothetical protein HYY84_11800 [Deltaproteobacteria bacterium]|nr:hypothetical protein [Deltaproteobacteria bacterium]
MRFKVDIQVTDQVSLLVSGDSDAPLSAINSEIERFVSSLRGVLSQESEGAGEGWYSAFTETPGGRVILTEGPLRKAQVADAALLIIYGYRHVAKKDAVRATAISASLRESGFHGAKGLAQKLSRHKKLLHATGERRARTYSLTDDGVKYCEELISKK